MSRILLVEDDDLIGTMVRLNLQQEGFTVDWLQRGDMVAAELGRRTYDAILLDIDLPGRSGVEVARDARRDGIGTPIVMLTALDGVDSKVVALEAGADDYVCKPFDVAELVARVRAQIRRSRAPIEVGSQQVVRVGAGSFDRSRRTLHTSTGLSVTPSDREADLLMLLVRNPDRVLTRADILDEVWGMNAMPSERTVDNFIVRLRRWIEPDPDAPIHIVTVRGTGYRFTP